MFARGVPVAGSGKAEVMLDGYTFRQTQLAYIKAAMDQITEYRPFGNSPQQVAGFIAESEARKTAFFAKNSLQESGRASLRLAHEAGHAAAVQVYAIMKSTYTADAKSWQLITRLPKGDNSPVKTINRMAAMAELWSTLPFPPGQSAQFVAGNITLAQFQGLLGALRDKQSDGVSCNQAFQKEEGNLHERDEVNRRFISGALIQGRAQFAPGTPDRKVIDAIPTAPSTLAPAQSLITVATSPAPGAVHLEFSALHATSFEVWHKAPGQPAFVHVGDVILPGVYDALGLAPGAHEYEIVGVNSRGAGPASAPGTINVAAQAVA